MKLYFLKRILFSNRWFHFHSDIYSTCKKKLDPECFLHSIWLPTYLWTSQCILSTIYSQIISICFFIWCFEEFIYHKYFQITFHYSIQKSNEITPWLFVYLCYSVTGCVHRMFNLMGITPWLFVCLCYSVTMVTGQVHWMFSLMGITLIVCLFVL